MTLFLVVILITRSFSSRNPAELCFKEEHGNSGWPFLGGGELQQQRV